MSHLSSKTANNENGFTLIELLVVILIIGILAAIAIPAFIGQRDKGSDASAKSDVRNMASQIEACWQDNQTYVGCGATLTSANTGLPVGTGPGQVSIVAETTTGYEITATSKALTGGVPNTFTLVHNIAGVFTRQCTGTDGCNAGSW